MRDRHIPRLCRSCQAPMARQEDSCWRCGAQWASEDVPSTTLRVIAGGRLEPPITEIARAKTRAADAGWANEGGSDGSEVAAGSLRAVAAAR